MRLNDLRRWRELVLVDYAAGLISKETAQAKCRGLTRAIEAMAKENLRRYREHFGEEYHDGKAHGLQGQ